MSGNGFTHISVTETESNGTINNQPSAPYTVQSGSKISVNFLPPPCPYNVFYDVYVWHDSNGDGNRDPSEVTKTISGGTPDQGVPLWNTPNYEIPSTVQAGDVITIVLRTQCEEPEGLVPVQLSVDILVV